MRHQIKWFLAAGFASSPALAAPLAQRDADSSPHYFQEQCKAGGGAPLWMPNPDNDSLSASGQNGIHQQDVRWNTGLVTSDLTGGTLTLPEVDAQGKAWAAVMSAVARVAPLHLQQMFIDRKTVKIIPWCLHSYDTLTIDFSAPGHPVRPTEGLKKKKNTISPNLPKYDYVGAEVKALIELVNDGANNPLHLTSGWAWPNVLYDAYFNKLKLNRPIEEGKVDDQALLQDGVEFLATLTARDSEAVSANGVSGTLKEVDKTPTIVQKRIEPLNGVTPIGSTASITPGMDLYSISSSASEDYMLVWDPSSGSDTKVYTGSTIGAAQLVRTDGNWDAFVGKEGNWVVDGVVMG